MVIHDHVEAAQAARIAEFQDLAIEAAVENHAGIAQRTVADKYWDTTDGVVDDLVPEQDAQRVGAEIAVDTDAENRLQRTDVGLGDRDEERIIDRRDRIACGAIGIDLVEGDRMQLEVGLRELLAPLRRPLAPEQTRYEPEYGCEQQNYSRANERDLVEPAEPAYGGRHRR